MNPVPGKHMRAGRLALGLIALVTACLVIPCMVSAQTPGAPAMHQYRPQPDNNASGAYPPAQAYPQNQYQHSRDPYGRQYNYQRQWSYQTAPRPGYPLQSTQAGYLQPSVEATLDSSEAYVHQNLILKIDVISQNSLASLDIGLPENDDYVLRKLGDTTAHARKSGSKQEVITRLYYQLIPLKAGELLIPAFEVTGQQTTQGSYLSEFRITTRSPINIDVKPANPSIRPWLPLYNYAVNAKVTNDEIIEEGKPVTVLIEQTAEGMSGTQLPSVEHQLQSEHHKLYRERTEYESTISKSGKMFGKRIDEFTIVPQHGDMVWIPGISVDWWNIERNRRETSTIPIRHINSDQGIFGLSDPFYGYILPTVDSWMFWMPLAILTFVAGLYWTWIWSQSRSAGSRIRLWLYEMSEPLRERFSSFASRLSPRRHMHRLRRLMADSLPRSFRLWYCVRSADNEKDPEVWSQVLRFLMNRRLGITAQVSMTQLARHIVEIHPGADTARVTTLLQQLENAIYGRGSIDNFDLWKKQFKQQIKPRPLKWLRKKGHGKRPKLPKLNPTMQ